MRMTRFCSRRRCCYQRLAELWTGFCTMSMVTCLQRNLLRTGQTGRFCPQGMKMCTLLTHPCCTERKETFKNTSVRTPSLQAARSARKIMKPYTLSSSSIRSPSLDYLPIVCSLRLAPRSSSSATSTRLQDFAMAPGWKSGASARGLLKLRSSLAPMLVMWCSSQGLHWRLQPKYSHSHYSDANSLCS
ncbi:uncharacterized protein EV422DRAFT_513315 [Fimicolochytrium jonesii]|uniref:uncharacterized protein n=1 Tax=Fimicolochytrium jonesii TaxID=1396493 RepID=UPI0022FE3C3E|nr:uncharacterized protein EV422DRAFT_513315 [Fimicolochytrium jonesii]KAI8825558.1 hypothetical protein EV422DRAFT_513315 [Fimicolochytrium jonesii]